MRRAEDEKEKEVTAATVTSEQSEAQLNKEIITHGRLKNHIC